MRALLVILLLLAGLAVVADRVAVEMAEDQVAEAIARQGDLAGPPEVEIPGWPFLTQAVGGRYDEVRIALSAEDLDRPEGTRADVTLRGVRLPLSDVLSGSAEEVPVERIEGTATLPYELLSAELGPGTALAPEEGGLRITRTVEVLGATVPLTAVGQVTLDGDELVVDVDEASAAGVDVPDVVVDRASDALDLRYRVALPFDLQLTGVTPTERGVEVEVEATDTVLRGPEPG